MKGILSVFITIICFQGMSQELEMLKLNGNFFVRETGTNTDTISSKVGIDVAIQNQKGLLVVHGIEDFGADTLIKFQGINVVDQMKSSISKGYASEGYVYMNHYNVSFNEGESAQKGYISYDPNLNAYRIILTKGDTSYSIHSDDIYFHNWSRQRLHERAYNLSGFDLYEKGENGYLKSGESELEGRIVLGDENVTITLGKNTENVPVWYKARAHSVFMYVGNSQEFRIDNLKNEIVYFSQLTGEVYQRMYVFKLEKKE